MNSTGKPKPAKLWKNSVKIDKKMKSKKNATFDKANDLSDNASMNDIEIVGDVNKSTPSKSSLKRKSQSLDFSGKKKFKSEENNEKNISKKNQQKSKMKKELKEGIKSDIKSQTKSNKMEKPSNMTRKDWKQLRLNKKSKTTSDSTKKPTVDMNKKGAWKEHHMKQKGKTDVLELGKQLKKLWEELRCEDCKPERKCRLIMQICELVKGRVKEFVYAHDTVRVLECVIAEGGDSHRALLFDELKDEIVTLAKSKYGKFFLIKMLKYGSKEQKASILKAFQGKIIKLIKNTDAATVVETFFNESANSIQRFEMIQEFFGPSFKFFKVTNCHSLQQLIEENPEKKKSILDNMKDELMKVLEKSVIKHSIVHYVLWQFMKNADQSSKSDIIESLKEGVPEILHTKDGSRVAMHCVWYGTSKDRKVIIKSMKQYVNKIAMEEFGHMVLLAIFDCVDDTLAVEKNIIRELVRNMLQLSQHIHGKKVLIYLLSPRDPHFFHPDIINILKVGDENTVSKKSTEVRRAELKATIAEPLLQLIQQNIKELFTNTTFCHFTCTVLAHAVCSKKETFESIAELLVEPYNSEIIHPVEQTGSSFLFKQLIIRDQNTSETDCYFSEVLVNKVPVGVMASWIECNRGAFLLVNLIETGLPNVVQRVKVELEGKKKQLTKKTFEGAKVLLKKLKPGPVNNTE